MNVKIGRKNEAKIKNSMNVKIGNLTNMKIRLKINLLSLCVLKDSTYFFCFIFISPLTLPI